MTRSKRELEQVHICLGTRGYPQAHPDRYGCYILNTVLGGSMSSRLFQNIREKRGLVYSISSGVTAYSDSGLFSIYAGTSRGSAREVIGLTLEEIRKLCGEKLEGGGAAAREGPPQGAAWSSPWSTPAPA